MLSKKAKKLSHKNVTLMQGAQLPCFFLLPHISTNTHRRRRQPCVSHELHELERSVQFAALQQTVHQSCARHLQAVGTHNAGGEGLAHRFFILLYATAKNAIVLHFEGVSIQAKNEELDDLSNFQKVNILNLRKYGA